MYLTIKGRHVPFITDAVVCMWLIMALIAVFTFILTRRLEKVPRGGQKAAEALVESLNNLAKSSIGHHWQPFSAYVGTVLIFLAFSNLWGLFNIIPGFPYMRPPTKNLNVTAAFALSTAALVFVVDFKYKGFKGWARSFIAPSPIYGVVKLMDYAVRPLSLALRLFGNIFGGYIVVELLYRACALVAPAVAGIYFDLFDGALQAYVFAFLTMVYLQEATENTV